MDNIKKQVNITDDELIMKIYEECDKDEFKTILKLLNIENDTKKENEGKNKDIELFRKIMKDKEEYLYDKLNKN